VPITYQYETLATLRERAKAEVGKVVVGQGRAVELLLDRGDGARPRAAGRPARHGEDAARRATAYVLGADFNRVQFTPDTTPTELVGENITRAGETKFISGTIFTNVLLADEINRRRRAPRPRCSRRWPSAASRSRAACTGCPTRSS
jgi:MoxR-like ATPase